MTTQINYRKRDSTTADITIPHNATTGNDDHTGATDGDDGYVEQMSDPTDG